MVDGNFHGVNFPSEQSEFFQAFFKRCPFGLNLCRMDGRWVESNSAFLDIIGYTAQEANDDNITYWDLTPGKYEPDEEVQLESLRSRGVYGPYEKEFIRKDGSLIPVRLNGFVIEKDSEAYIWSMIEDLTKERAIKDELLRSSQFNQGILENVPVSIFVKDSHRDWKIIVWNRRAEELFNIRREDILGKTDHDVFPKDQADFFRLKDIETLNSQKAVHISEEPVDTPGQATIWLRTIKAPLNDVDGIPRYLLGITEDITDERQSAQKLNESHEQLSQAIEISEKASQAKSMFLSNMSHEIRSPLNSVIGFADLLANSDLRGEQSQYVEMLQRGGDRLLSVVNDILDIQRIESGSMNVHAEWEHLLTMIESTTDLMKYSAVKGDLKFVTKLQVSPDLMVKTDSKFIHQILTNLISNAIKFTEPGGEIIVRAEVSEAREGLGELRIVVSDSGVGIPAEVQKHIFEPFEQVDSSVRKRHGGTGLGLAIVKGLVAELGGEILLTSTDGEGSTFELSIPVEIKNTEAEVEGCAPHFRPH